MKAQRMKCIFSCFKTIAFFLINKNILDKVKLLASNYGSKYIRSARDNIDETFSSWYNSEILPLVDAIALVFPKVFPEKRAPNISISCHFCDRIC